MIENDDDRKLKQFFSEARQADREATPSFLETRRGVIAPPNAPARSFSLGFVLGGVTSLVVVAVSIWIVFEEPQVLRGITGSAPPPAAEAPPTTGPAPSAPLDEQATLPEPVSRAEDRRGEVADTAPETASPPPPRPSPKSSESDRLGSGSGLTEPGRVTVAPSGSQAEERGGDEQVFRGVPGWRIPADTVTVGTPSKDEEAIENDLDLDPGLRKAVDPEKAPDPSKVEAKPGARPLTKAELERLQAGAARNMKPGSPSVARPTKSSGTRSALEELGEVGGGVSWIQLGEMLREMDPQEARSTMRVLRQALQTPESRIGLEHLQRYVSGEGEDDSTSSETENEFTLVIEKTRSTFPLAGHGASYGNVARFLERGKMPPPEIVRIEELINYFPYDYPEPRGRDPLAVDVEVASCPWKPDHRLLRIGIRSRELLRADRGGAHLIFLVDVSDSMKRQDRLPQFKAALTLLVEQLDYRDHVTIVAFAEGYGVQLPSTPGDRKGEIADALKELRAREGHDGSAGLLNAYQIARTHFLSRGENRVVLVTDGNLVWGETERDELPALIRHDVSGGVALTVLGMGPADAAHDQLQQLADSADGSYSKVGSLREALQRLAGELDSSRVAVAENANIEIEFNPMEIHSYRLIGYGPSGAASGEGGIRGHRIASGKRITAVYEIVPRNPGQPLGGLPQRRKGTEAYWVGNRTGELLTLTLSYVEPADGQADTIVHSLIDHGMGFEAATPDFKFAAAVAGFGLLLRDSPHRGDLTYPRLQQLVSQGIPPMRGGYQGILLDLVTRARTISEMGR